MARTWISLGISIVGVAAVIASFLWPRFDGGRSAWTEQKAVELQRAQSTLHKLGGHEHSGPIQRSQSSLLSHEDQEYQAALTTHENLRAELEHAQNRGQRIRQWLLFGGLALVIAGWIVAKAPEAAKA
jgi:hypothetical protein